MKLTEKDYADAKIALAIHAQRFPPTTTVYHSDIRDTRDNRDPGALGEALLATRKRAPKSPLSRLYDRHAARLADAGR